jgi:DNA repair protein RadD
MITLRKNQTEPIRRAIEFFNMETPRPSLIVLPTAWGKSILTAFVAKSIEDKLLVLQPSKELLEQNYKKYVSLCEFETGAGIYSASFGRKEVNKITYATIGSIKNLGAMFKKLGFTKLLIDEAHLYPREADSMLGTFLSESGITHVLGITATPIKLQQNTDLSGGRYSKLVMLTSRSKKGNFFKDIIHVGQVGEMVEMGFWSRLEYKVTGFDASKLVYNSSKSEYTDESIEKAFISNNIHEQIKQQLNENSDRKHILVFVPSVSEAITLSREYSDSAAIYGDMKKDDRARVIDDFRSGRTRVMFNVRVLSTGFDYTGIDCIILGISTASVALFYQILGRGTRIDTGKKDCLIIDLSGNVSRFGRVEDIKFEKDGAVWRMFGSDDRLLSGIPIHELGSVTKSSLEVKKTEKKAFGKAIDVMPFGKYKGEPIAGIPKDYRLWMLEKFDWGAHNAGLREALLITI